MCYRLFWISLGNLRLLCGTAMGKCFKWDWRWTDALWNKWTVNWVNVSIFPRLRGPLGTRNFWCKHRPLASLPVTIWIQKAGDMAFGADSEYWYSASGFSPQTLPVMCKTLFYEDLPSILNGYNITVLLLTFVGKLICCYVYVVLYCHLVAKFSKASVISHF